MISLDMKKAIFVGAMRDCAPYLPQVLSNIDRLSRCFLEVAYVFVENDSIDHTKKIINTWLETGQEKITPKQFGLSESITVLEPAASGSNPGQESRR